LLVVVLLVVGLAGATFAVARDAGADVAGGAMMDRCGDTAYAVTLESILVASPEPEATVEPGPVGLYRMVDQRFGGLFAFEISGTPVIETHGTSLGVFCLEAGGTVPVEGYRGFVITISLAEDAAGPLHLILQGYAEDPSGDVATGSYELCVDPQCNGAIQTLPETTELDLKPGQSIRLVNPVLGLANTGTETVVFSVSSLAPSGGACPTRCWVSP
jgi:hypothetical protein